MMKKLTALGTLGLVSTLTGLAQANDGGYSFAGITLHEVLDAFEMLPSQE